MENVLASEVQQSFSAYKQIKNPRKISPSFVSKTCENMHVQRGLLLAPPARSLSYSYTPSSLALHNYNYIQHVQQHHQQTSSPPPLLPLPVTKPRHSSLPSPSRKPSRARDQSLTPKKSKQPTKREEANTKPAVEKKISKPQQTESLTVDATLNHPLGPDPNDLPKDVSKMFCAGFVAVNNKYQDFEKFSGSVFTISPPPSSLPLPKFSMRPKQLINCKAEAAASGVDAGATDNLRRLLRLR